jgi:60 kDa SS-A/Ro ribonucleoprotein
MSVYRAFASKKTLTPQTQPIPGRETEMVQNAAGGYVFQIGDWERLERFLIIGSDGGTYYASGAKLTAENAACAIRCIKENGERAVKARL